MRIGVTRAVVALAATAALVAGCGDDGQSRAQPDATGVGDDNGGAPGDVDDAVEVDDVVTNLEVPWGIAFLPDGSALIAERDSAAVKHLSPSGVVRNVGEVAGVAPRGEGGLLGLATSGQTVFAYFTAEDDNRVVRMNFDGVALTGQEPVLTGIPAGSIHDGGRIAFGPDGNLYIATGDSGDVGLAQDLSSLGGKILRIRPDGSIPPDNPDPSSPVWSYGHRNIQGLAWDAGDRLWATEFGANAWDELNLIEAGGNYGWPLAEGRGDIPGLINPVLQWSTAEASPSGLAYWGESLWMAALRGQRLYQIPVGPDGAAGEPVALFTGRYGRLRTVVAAPDGTLWFTTSNRDGRGSPRDGDDRILQFQP